MNELLKGIQASLNKETLYKCLSKMFNFSVSDVNGWQIESFCSRPLNFTTEGIYRIYGSVIIMGKETSWSLIVKIIKQDHADKNHPQHHNFWKREALINQSKLLDDLPEVIHTPQCYMVEEKPNGTVWIWMEEIKKNNIELWSENEFAFVAKQLGIFNGAYVMGKEIPDYTWICRNWLKSWVNDCKKYSIDPTNYYPQLKGQYDLDDIWNSFIYLNQNREKHFYTLSTLPRVLAHQDLSKQNMFIHRIQGSEKKLTFIDWQFLSISGLGEDLGKLYGVALSQRDIPIEKGEFYQELLFRNYLEGLMDAGWNGDRALPRYGFCASFALRSAWELPKLIRLSASSPTELDSRNICAKKLLTRIVSIQMDLGKEANELLSKTSLCIH
ncbi:MAG: phosphotransferase [Heyndrickxia sp.]